MTIKTYILNYTAYAALHNFSVLANQPWAMLLTSGHANHVYSRFDILTADPLVMLTTYGNITTIVKGGSVLQSNEDPLLIVRRECDMIGVTPLFNDALPFQGGAIGLFGYDLARRFEKLPKLAKQDLSTPDMAVGIYDWALIADHCLKKLTLVSLNDANARWKWLLAQAKTKTISFRLTSRWHSNMNFKGYTSRFYKVKKYIEKGECYQVNLAQRFQATYTGNEWHAFLNFNRRNCAPFSAFIRLPMSVVMSLSPERFLFLQKGEIETRPIKGTLPRLLDPINDIKQIKKLANAEKDRAENLMIVDLMRNDLSRIAVTNSVHVPELFIVESFAAVHHLVSTIRARLLQTFFPVDLLRACFPGGSITGAPKIRAMEIIEELEPNRRNAWCGSIGYISLCGRMDSSIAIRTLIAEKQHLYCSAGSGLVADSILEQEYEETFNKVNRILHIDANTKYKF
ncbi:aminodeoxychorismate synthase component 1 [Candidatus Pantoea carbekii]|uniref:aminodeoxychorismate synthase n=1 Tax=Candidatus Pantoea carbekii TaxID=1235990 RepID=U3U344_9GAMM|nr:aminodeoxychorismate synthase component 1 [Candidatus Pantoea carbekii]AKC32050.1 para-aminobenzoate synthase component I PabB [Candidatus Pantoea carbekii]BAO00576.1 PabB protein [Candidatus Pantoea carbekii]